jgi:hypothetical protein
MPSLDYDTIVTLTTAAPDGRRRVVMVGTLRMAFAAALEMPGDESTTARIAGAGLPPGGTWLPPFGVVPLPEKGRMPRATPPARPIHA